MMTSEDMKEMIEYDEFLANFVGPPTEQEWGDMQQAELEYIDHKMLLNAI